MIPLNKHLKITYLILAALSLGSLPGFADILYVANEGNDTIETISSAGAGSTFVSSPSGVYGSLAFDSSGNLYDAYASGIYEFTPQGVRSSFASTGTDANGLAFDSAGNLYVDNYYGSTIEEFNPQGIGSTFATGLSTPYGLAFNSAGDLFVANQGTDSVEEFTPQGVGSTFATGLDNPTGLAFDTSGNLYVANADSTGSTIEKFTPGGVGSVFASTGLDNPWGLAFDSAGNLYASNEYGTNGNTIEEFTPGGVGSVFATGLSTPTGLAFTNNSGQPLPLVNEAPEVPTWPLLLTGLVCLLFWSRSNLAFRATRG